MVLVVVWMTDSPRYTGEFYRRQWRDGGSSLSTGQTAVMGIILLILYVFVYAPLCIAKAVRGWQT